VCQEKTPLPGPAGSPIDGFNDISPLIPQARLGKVRRYKTLDYLAHELYSPK